MANTAAVPEEAPATAKSMLRAAPSAAGAGPRYTYQYLHPPGAGVSDVETSS